MTYFGIADRDWALSTQWVNAVTFQRFQKQGLSALFLAGFWIIYYKEEEYKAQVFSGWLKKLIFLPIYCKVQHHCTLQMLGSSQWIITSPSLLNIRASIRIKTAIHIILTT